MYSAPAAQACIWAACYLNIQPLLDLFRHSHLFAWITEPIHSQERSSRLAARVETYEDRVEESCALFEHVDAVLSVGRREIQWGENPEHFPQRFNVQWTHVLPIESVP